MNASEIISKKFLAQYPESLKIFEDSCKYTIANGLFFIKGVLLHREKKVSYNEQSVVSEELQSYLSELGYKNSIISHNDTYFTKKGYESGVVFVVFLSVAAIKLYLEENEKWAKSVKAKSRFDKEAPRPLYEQIKYLDIYKSS